GFAGAVVGGAARAHLAAGEVEDGGAMPLLHRFEKRAAAGLLDVVAVRGDGEYVHHRLIWRPGDLVIGRHFFRSTRKRASSLRVLARSPKGSRSAQAALTISSALRIDSSMP